MSIAKEIRDKSLPADHLGQLPPGYERNEENIRRTDSLAEQAAKAGETAGSIQSDVLHREEREILAQFNPYTLELEVTHPNLERCPTHNLPPFNPQSPDEPYHDPDFCPYLWIKSNSTVIAAYKAMGYRAVQGDDLECKEHKGDHAAAGSSLRGVGDALLYWIPLEKLKGLRRHQHNKALALGAVEKAWEDEANYSPNSPTRKFGPLAHGDPNDPLLKRTVFRGTHGQIDRLSDALKTGRPMDRAIQVRDE